MHHKKHSLQHLFSAFGARLGQGTDAAPSPLGAHGPFGQALISALSIFLGNALLALTVQLFLLPSGLMSTGATGLALVAHHLTGVSVSAFIFLFNLCMLGVGFLFLGKRFFLSTVVSSLAYPLFLSLFERALAGIHVTQEPLLNVFFAGAGTGLALGIVMRAGASTGGMDIPPLILNRFFRVPIHIGLYFFDFCTLAAQAVFHTPEDFLYGLLLVLTTSLALNKLLLWGVSKTEVKIISSRPEELCRQILDELDRGVTLLHGEGGYLHKQTPVLLSVVSNRELVKLEKLVLRLDPGAFMIVSRVTEVLGRGFSYEKERRAAP